MRWESFGMVGFDLGPLLEGQMRTAKLKSAYNSLIIGPRGFGALSLRWIQFASVLRCARSSCYRVGGMHAPSNVILLSVFASVFPQICVVLRAHYMPFSVSFEKFYLNNRSVSWPFFHHFNRNLWTNLFF